jgi:hypothetical protein
MGGSMYAIANTLVTILRGTSVDSLGDIIDSPVAIATGIIAFISYPTMSPLRPIVLGSTVYEPGSPEPSTTRLAVCTLPSGTDLRNSDQVLDQFTDLLYEVYQVTQLGWAGAKPDVIASLKRVTTTEQA